VDHMLEIVLAVVALVLGACLVPLLLQMRRTAKAVQELAESARLDLNRIAQDVHQTCGQVDKVTALVEKSLEFPASASGLAAVLLRSLSALFGPTSAPWLEGLVTAVKMGLDFLRRPRRAAPAKENTDE